MGRLKKNHIKKVGEILAREQASPDERHRALEDLSLWREAHLAPFQSMLSILEKAARDANIDFVLFVRLMRIDTIEGKLRRPGHTYKLNTMNDIAGCRLILPSIDALRAAASTLKSNLGPALYDTDDYLIRPQKSGYRGIHLISRFDSPDYGLERLRVETQLRTDIQHSWASTLELYDVLTGSGLKFGDGDKDQLRFFQILSYLFSERETGRPPEGKMELVDELRHLERSLGIVEHLRGAHDSVVALGDINSINENSYCLISLDYETQEAFIKSYPQAQATEAVAKYAEEEMQKKGRPYADALMLKASSLEALKRALPNYFSGISLFLEQIEAYLP